MYLYALWDFSEEYGQLWMLSRPDRRLSWYQELVVRSRIWYATDCAVTYLWPGLYSDWDR